MATPSPRIAYVLGGSPDTPPGWCKKAVEGWTWTPKDATKVKPLSSPPAYAVFMLHTDANAFMRLFGSHNKATPLTNTHESWSRECIIHVLTSGVVHNEYPVRGSLQRFLRLDDDGSPNDDPSIFTEEFPFSHSQDATPASRFLMAVSSILHQCMSAQQLRVDLRRLRAAARPSLGVDDIVAMITKEPTPPMLTLPLRTFGVYGVTHAQLDAIPSLFGGELTNITRINDAPNVAFIVGTRAERYEASSGVYVYLVYPADAGVELTDHHQRINGRNEADVLPIPSLESVDAQTLETALTVVLERQRDANSRGGGVSVESMSVIMQRVAGDARRLNVGPEKLDTARLPLYNKQE